MSFYNNNFIICPGFEKCSTTSLYAFLQNRDGITLTTEKETFFFNGRFDDGETGYEKMYLSDDSLNSDDNTWHTDITPSYFRQPRTFSRIRQCLTGEVVIIFLIRNPVKRAFSLYWHDLVRHISRGEKEANKFKNFRNFSFDHCTDYNDNYLITPYADTLEKWIDAYPGKVIIHTIEDVIKNPDTLINDINTKTGLSLTTGASYPRENEAWTANLTINPKGVRRHDQRGTKLIELKRQEAINAMAIQGTFTHFLSKEKCEQLFETFFAEDTKRCEEILGRELSYFKKQNDILSPIVKSYLR